MEYRFASNSLPVYIFQRLFLVWTRTSNEMAKLAAAALFANNRGESSLNPPMIHRQHAENEDIFANFAIRFANFANWVMALDPPHRFHNGLPPLVWFASTNQHKMKRNNFFYVGGLRCENFLYWRC
jgi:hypothetical protein